MLRLQAQAQCQAEIQVLLAGDGNASSKAALATLSPKLWEFVETLLLKSNIVTKSSDRTDHSGSALEGEDILSTSGSEPTVHQLCAVPYCLPSRLGFPSQAPNSSSTCTHFPLLLRFSTAISCSVSHCITEHTKMLGWNSWFLNLMGSQ